MKSKNNVEKPISKVTPPPPPSVIATKAPVPVLPPKVIQSTPVLRPQSPPLPELLPIDPVVEKPISPIVVSTPPPPTTPTTPLTNNTDTNQKKKKKGFKKIASLVLPPGMDQFVKTIQAPIQQIESMMQDEDKMIQEDQEAQTKFHSMDLF